MSPEAKIIPSVSVTYARNGSSTKSNALGMRPMQERAYEKRGEQFLLLKSPPASGKSRALMFIALDKITHQGLKQAIIVVPERSIGASFNDEPLMKYGFWADWHVEPKWNLCNAPGGENGSKVKAVGAFLESDDKVLVCTHATFRFAVDEYGVEAFDDRLIAVDEFHHVSANPDNKLGAHLGQFIARDRVHIVAMTGSYFRGDAEAVLSPQDEEKFDTVTYTYYEQLNGYEHLKQLDMGYYFYSGSYIEDIPKVLDLSEKTIIHIPNVNSRESTKRGKTTEVSEIMGALGSWEGKDLETGFDRVRVANGDVLKIADLVDDGPERHAKVLASLKDPAQKHNRDNVDIIIALGMAKEGFDWIWCEHALTIGYRSSLTEIVQIIGRATRDAPGKVRARFSNLIAAPDASDEAVTEAVNDTLKAIAASLLMEQVLAPRFEFKPKNPESKPVDGYHYEGGYDPGKCNVGFNEETGRFQVEIKGLTEPKSTEAARICQEDLNEVIAAFVQDKIVVERGLFDEELVPEELTQVRLGKIIKDKYPELDAEDQEAVRQHAIAALTLTQQAKKEALGGGGTEPTANTALIDGVRRFVNVRDLDVDLIDRINPFGEAYAILSKAMNEDNLKQVATAISAKKTKLTPEEAKELAIRAVKFKKERGRIPAIDSQDAWERRMAEGAAAFVRYKDEGRYERN
jgi:superfamily II DNA or RNA helicase